MTHDEHKAWLDGLKPGDVAAIAYQHDHPVGQLCTVSRRTASRIFIKRDGGGFEVACGLDGRPRGSAAMRYDRLYPYTEAMRRGSMEKELEHWSRYQAGRDIPRLKLDDIAKVKALVDGLLAEGGAA